MQRRKFLIGAGSAAVGASALIGSGAFTSVEAERTVTVDVTGDASAYLALTGDEEYVSTDGSGEMLTIDLGGATTNNGGEGFNDDAITTVEAVNIENRGTNDVDVTIDDDSLGGGVTATIDGTLTLPTGDTEERAIEFTVDTLNENPEEGDLGTLTINANETA